MLNPFFQHCRVRGPFVQAGSIGGLDDGTADDFDGTTDDVEAITVVVVVSGSSPQGTAVARGTAARSHSERALSEYIIAKTVVHRQQGEYETIEYSMFPKY
jgi:hypothetical protein